MQLLRTSDCTGAVRIAVLQANSERTVNALVVGQLVQGDDFPSYRIHLGSGAGSRSLVLWLTRDSAFGCFRQSRGKSASSFEANERSGEMTRVESLTLVCVAIAHAFLHRPGRVLEVRAGRVVGHCSVWRRRAATAFSATFSGTDVANAAVRVDRSSLH